MVASGEASLRAHLCAAATVAGTGTLVATGNIYRDTTGQRTSTGSTFSFFDPSKFYAYTLDPADQVESIVKRCAGPRANL